MTEYASIPEADVDPQIDELSIAVAHWHIRSWGGAEYLVTKLAESLDLETVYTLGKPSPDDPNPYGDVIFEDVINNLSFSTVRRIQRYGGRVFEYALWEDVDWREYGTFDILITSGATARSVITPDDTLHFNYCHSPPRWFYDLYHERKGSFTGHIARPLIRYLRSRDMTVDPRVDYYLVNSPIIQRRLWKYYKRESDVLYPPVDTDNYYYSEEQDYYLYLGRLDTEKGIQAIVAAFEPIDTTLVAAGAMGDISAELKARIKTADNIDYRGFVPETEKYRLLSECKGVVFNGKNEDFGIVPIEANASGKPCLARNDGFPGLFVEDGKNGLLHDGTASGIHQAVERMDRISFTPDKLMNSVHPFEITQFNSRLQKLLEGYYQSFSRLNF